MGNESTTKSVSTKFRGLTRSLSVALVTAKFCYETIKPVLQGKPTMPPTRSNSVLSSTTQGNGIATRARRTTSFGLAENSIIGKRKAESPLKKATKRSAFGDITNAIGKSANDTKNVLKNVTNAKAFGKFKEKKVVEKKEVVVKLPEKKEVVAPKPLKRAVDKPVRTAVRTRQSLKQTSSIPPAQPPKATARKTVVDSDAVVVQRPKPAVPAAKPAPKEPVRSSARLSARLSLTNDSGETSLYVSALDINPDEASASNEEIVVLDVKPVAAPESPERQLPPGVEDFDAENAHDPFAVSEYAMDIFEYLKSREPKYKIADYMDKQVDLTRFMRSLLVDWMVEVQENFELNHETLYLGVKIVDTYLSKVPVGKQTLQLVGAAAMFIASKFDERVPPLVDDLTYICDGAYTHNELIAMEVSILKVIGFDLAMPLSYRFLRRYARCAKMPMPQLTLSRYILELSLLEYSLITVSDSKLAAAALLLSLKMQNLGGWTPSLEYYSGYKLEDIHGLCHQLNDMLHKKPKTALQTVRNKYSHKVFFEVANIPLVDDLKL